ncbi:MAG: SagB/ThcOx family dehydrogenase [Chloroflexi bacterium]|nr:SagB/ThcOx family dehydrogenase [Chloroflexota bacterium]
MNRKLWFVLVALLLSVGGGACRTPTSNAPAAEASPAPGDLELPAPRLDGDVALEAAIAERRSVRSFTSTPLTLEEIGQLLWAAQGITDPQQGFRAAPSAGARYPLELYVILPEGVYWYRPEGHDLTRLSAEDMREAAWDAGLRQDALREAPAIFLFTAVYERTAERYGDRAERYIHMEIGHAAQNLALQAVAMDLGCVPIGAMHDEQLQSALNLPEDHAPLYLMPVGHPAP